MFLPLEISFGCEGIFATSEIDPHIHHTLRITSSFFPFVEMDNQPKHTTPPPLRPSKFGFQIGLPNLVGAPYTLELLLEHPLLVSITQDRHPGIFHQAHRFLFLQIVVPLQDGGLYEKDIRCLSFGELLSAHNKKPGDRPD
jgi:hypothetical protein